MNRFLLLTLLCASSVAIASGPQWHWVKVGNNMDHGWDVARGDAEVIIQGGQFSAKLFWVGSDKDVQISLKGSIANGRITAKETVHGSDYSGSTYRGMLTTKRWAGAISGATGVETITLSDGLGMIGITRAITK